MKHCKNYQNVTESWSEQMLLEKWHWWTCLMQGCHKPSICKKNCSICKPRQTPIKQGMPIHELKQRETQLFKSSWNFQYKELILANVFFYSQFLKYQINYLNYPSTDFPSQDHTTLYLDISRLEWMLENICKSFNWEGTCI